MNFVKTHFFVYLILKATASSASLLFTTTLEVAVPVIEKIEAFCEEVRSAREQNTLYGDEETLAKLGTLLPLYVGFTIAPYSAGLIFVELLIALTPFTDQSIYQYLTICAAILVTGGILHREHGAHRGPIHRHAL